MFRAWMNSAVQVCCTTSSVCSLVICSWRQTCRSSRPYRLTIADQAALSPSASALSTCATSKWSFCGETPEMPGLEMAGPEMAAPEVLVGEMLALDGLELDELELDGLELEMPRLGFAGVDRAGLDFATLGWAGLGRAGLTDVGTVDLHRR